MTTDPLPGTPAHTVLMHEAFADHQVANVTTEVEARTIGASIAWPALAPGRHTDVNPYFGIPHIAAFPVGGSALVVWDTGIPAPPTTNTPPHAGQDPHSAPRKQPARAPSEVGVPARGRSRDRRVRRHALRALTV